jgi:hypothetical protein
MKALIAVLALVAATQAQAYNVTKCQNGFGDIIVVEGFNCPAGWWPTY